MLKRPFTRHFVTALVFPIVILPALLWLLRPAVAGEPFSPGVGMTDGAHFVSIQNLDGTFARVLPPKSLHGVHPKSKAEVKLDYGMPCLIGEGATFTGLGSDGLRVLVSLNENPAEEYYSGQIVSVREGYASATGRACMPETLFWIDNKEYSTALRQLETHQRLEREANAETLRDRALVRRILDERFMKKAARLPAEATTKRK